MNASRTISKITIYLVATLALGALILSYDNLVGAASDNGITGWKSYIWPLLLDFALIVFSLTVVRNSLLGERQVWPWAMVGLFTLGTLGFNVLHADHNLTSRVMAAVAPIALFLSFETLMSQLKSEVNRQAIVHSLDQLSAQTGDLDNRIEDKKAQIVHLEDRIAALKEQQAALERGQFAEKSGFAPGDLVALDQANDARQETVEQRRGQLAGLMQDNPNLTNVDLADLLGVSVSTIKGDKRALKERTNGHYN